VTVLLIATLYCHTLLHIELHSLLFLLPLILSPPFRLHLAALEQLQVLTTQLRAKQADYEGLHCQLDAANADCVALRSQLVLKEEGEEEALASRELRLTELQAETSELKSALADSQNGHDNLLLQYQDLEKHHAELTKSINDQAAEALSQQAARDQELSALQAHHALVLGELQMLRQAYDALEAEWGAMAQQVSVLEQIQGANEEQLAALVEEREVLRQSHLDLSQQVMKCVSRL
jgi:chromosome segregation ATPase